MRTVMGFALTGAHDALKHKTMPPKCERWVRLCRGYGLGEILRHRKPKQTDRSTVPDDKGIAIKKYLEENRQQKRCKKNRRNC
jgi:hypothetical protein